MKAGRREALKMSAAVGAGAALAGCSRIVNRVTAPEVPASLALPKMAADPVVRLLNRAAYGPRPGDAAMVANLGRERWIEQQLNPDDEEDNLLNWRLAGLEAFQIDAAELGDEPLEEILRQLQQAAILRAVYSRHQLRERMVEFWSNHFNIYARKGVGAWFKPTDELSVIRKNALGKFPDLLRASAHSPAMLMYLDNQVNRRKDAKGAGANENYARELMELHTLGVHGGYSQKDVQEVARCLTGWTVEDRKLQERLFAKDRKVPGSFRFDASRHDDGPKVVLGHRIPPGGGAKDGELVLDILSNHASTAKFIAGKMCRYFLGDAAHNWTDKLAGTYLDTGGDIRAMLRPLLLSDDLHRSPPIMKRPFDFVVSSLRALNANTDANRPLQAELARMGQPLYQWPMPDGYPDKTSAWTGSLLARWNFAASLLTAGIPGTAVELDRLRITDSTLKLADSLVELILAQPAHAKSIKPLRDRVAAHAAKIAASKSPKRSATPECAALLLASPEFQWR